MSSPERRVVLCPEAEDDFAVILAHSRQMWGADQADADEAAIDGASRASAAFQSLAGAEKMPSPGRIAIASDSM